MTVGVPYRVPVPVPGAKYMPLGRLPEYRAIVGVGLPLAVTLKVPYTDGVNVVLAALVKATAPAGFTVRVKPWETASVPLLAVIVIG